MTVQSRKTAIPCWILSALRVQEATAVATLDVDVLGYWPRSLPPPAMLQQALSLF